jgi:hypothetical protein
MCQAFSLGEMLLVHIQLHEPPVRQELGFYIYNPLTVGNTPDANNTKIIRFDLETGEPMLHVQGMRGSTRLVLKIPLQIQRIASNTKPTFK